ncbi:MAG: class I adenylate-forming enzyme family protein [Ilumatobacter sp.]
MNLARVIEAHAADRVALIADGATVTYGELRGRVAEMSTLLADRGVGVGTEVALASANDEAFVVSTLSVLALGGIVLPLNPTSPTPELTRKLDVANPSMLLVGNAGRLYLDDESITLEMVDLVEMHAAATAAAKHDATVSFADRHNDDPAFYLATSGVSGVAKVAMLSHANLSFIHKAMKYTEPSMGPDDVVLGVLPFTHIFGLNVVLLAPLEAGSAIVLQSRFDAAESLRLVRDHGVTMLSGAPPMWQRWAVTEAPDDSLATVKRAGSGAAALPLGVFERVKERFGIEISQGYGLTETSPVVTVGLGATIRPTSVGQVLPGVEVALVDESGAPVDVGDEGEIVVRGPGVFLGYLHDDEATDAMLSEDGWLWTGDVGIFDEDGYLYLVDRIKDIVIVSGFNVYPAEVENVLMSHPEVTGAIVTGTADEESGEAVVAHVSGAASQEALEEFVAEHLSSYKRPTHYHFLDDLPIAPNGKAIRRALR